MVSQLEFIPLDTYQNNLSKFKEKDRQRIEKAVIDRLSFKPNHGHTLKNVIVVSGKKLYGLRHFKVGVQNYKKGAYVLYRHCKECYNNEYYLKSKVKCQFCDSNKLDRIVLFDVRPRGVGYKK
jgi:hypothetical protein